jgi:hypothetical protein
LKVRYLDKVPAKETLPHRVYGANGDWPEQGNLVCSRIQASGKFKANGEAVNWTENHIYQVENGKIVEWWGEGGPPLG